MLVACRSPSAGAAVSTSWASRRRPRLSPLLEIETCDSSNARRKVLRVPEGAHRSSRPLRAVKHSPQARMQAARCPASISRSSGTARRHSSMAIGQRGWKTQPGGGWSGLGTSPPSTMRSRRASTAGSGIGTAESSAFVYGCCGVVVERLAVGDLHDLAEVHHRDAVGDVADDGQVVGDEEVGEAELAPGGPRAG